MATPALPPWLSNPTTTNTTTHNPLLTLTLSPSAPRSPIEQQQHSPPLFHALLAECCQELEQGHNSWAAHRKEAAWRLRRVELQAEAERARRRREKAEEIQAKVAALREEEVAALERIDAEYKEQLRALRREADAKEMKLEEHWKVNHARLCRGLEKLGCRRR